VGKEVGTVWCNFDFDEGIGIEKVFDGGSDFEIGSENEKAVFFIGEADFGSGSEHAFGFNSAHFGFADLKSAGQSGSGEAAWNFITDFVVSGTAYNLTKRAFAGVNLGDFESVGVRVLDCLLDLGHHNLVALDTYFLEAFDFDASKG
jgi:hypothetical protein